LKKKHSVTLAHDDNKQALADAFAKITMPNCTLTITQIAIGATGPYGTVKRGKDYAVFNVPN